jgi:outer membrane protein TolC
MKKHGACAILMMVLLCFVQAQTLRLDDFLTTVINSHPLFSYESLSVAVEQAAQERHRGDEDWVLTARPYYMHQEPVASGIGVPEELDVVSGDIAIERAFWRTGGRLALSWTSSYTDQSVEDIVIPLFQDTIVMSAGPSRLYAHKVYLMYTQPLLQNLGGTLDRLAYTIDQHAIDIAALQAQENKEQLLLDCAARFLDWALVSEQLRIARERLTLAEEQLQRTERRYQSNLVEKLDVLRSKDAVRMAEQSIVVLQSQYRAKQAELAVISGSAELYTMSPLYDLYTRVSLPDIEEAIEDLQERSVIIQALEQRRIQLEQLRQGYQETSRPQLYLTIGAGLQSGDEDFGESIALDKPDALVALDFRYPLKGRRAQSDITKTDLEINRVITQISAVHIEYETALRGLLIMIDDMEAVLALNQEQIQSAKAKTQEELRLYTQGRNYLAFVIQSRDSEQQAAMTYAENAATYHHLIMQYYALMDELLPMYGGK